MKKKSLILMLISIIVFVSMVAIAAYAYFAASVDANASAVINATLPNGSFTFYVVTDGNIEYTFNANKMLASGSSTSSIASDDANLNVVLRSPDATSLTTCSYDLVWEWTSSVQYTESDVTLPYTGGYNYEMSVKGTSSTTGNPSSNPSTNANLDEKDLSKFTWTGTKGQSGYKTTLVSGATISSQSAETDTVTSWNILSQMYNIPVAQPNLQGKEFKAKVYVDNVDCNITNADSGSGGQVSSTKPTVVNGTIDTIGSEVAIGDEHFYIINSTDTTVTMLAKYNLLVGNNYLTDETTCEEYGYEWVVEEKCSMGSLSYDQCISWGLTWESVGECSSSYGKIPTKTIGYNMQSEIALGMACSEYVMYDSSSNVIATYTKSTKQSVFDALTSDQISNIDYVDCSDNTNNESSSTIAFDSEYTTTSHGYWTNDNDDLLTEYGVKYPALVYNDNATIKTYVDTYKEKLEEKYEVTISNARLIKYDELYNLGCVGTTEKCITSKVITNNRIWLFDTSFWSSSAVDYEAVWGVEAGGYFGGSIFRNELRYGVRPVLEISKDEFN